MFEQQSQTTTAAQHTNGVPPKLLQGRMKHPQAGHISIAHALLASLLESKAGYAFVGSVYVVNGSGHIQGARVPDVMFFQRERMAQYRGANPDWRDKPYTLVPDLAVEIISPDDRFSDVTRKVDVYMKDGVKAVWVIDPARKSATMYTQSRYITYNVNDTVTGGEMIPNFRMKVADIFE